jgi:hypothetical protein
MPSPTQNCTDITPECPVEATIYGYYPSLPANAFFLAWFGALLIIQAFQGIKYKTWTFMIAMTLGCLGEAIGTFHPPDVLFVRPADQIKVMSEE